MAKAEPSGDWLAAPRIGRILIVLGLLALPHLPQMPIWASAAVLGAGLWRWWIAQRALPLPNLWIRLALAATLTIGLGVYYGSLNGLESGAALLVTMSAMKLLETRSRRDCRLLVYLGYLLILAQMLRSQDLPWLAWMSAALVANTAVLIDLQHPQTLLSIRHNLGLGARIVLKAVPLAVILFVLFPRIPGPLWGLPQSTGEGKTGLSDSMEPGNISQLSQSDEVAFRVRFQDPPPNPREMYWRGPVLTEFDGYRWTPAKHFLPPVKMLAEPLNEPIRYEIQLDPHGRKFLLALDMPVFSLPDNTFMSPDYVVETRSAVMDARLIPLVSATHWRVGTQENRWVLAANLRLPAEINPRTRALAEQFVAATGDAESYVNRVLRHLREEPYFYTLEPPLLRGLNRIDQFLFDTRAGFCEHYAAAFVVLMRAAGIPARVVTGYQGAELNGPYYIVRQSDAHAWAEVWLQDQGWIRVDPVGAVAPDRIERGLAAALGDSELLPILARGRNFSGNWLVSARLAWDRIDAAWNRGILAFGPELQRRFLARFGMDDLRRMLIGLISFAVLFGALLAAHIAWSHRRRPDPDPLRALRDQWLRKAGLHLDPAQLGPQQMEQHFRQAGLWNAETERLLAHYTRLRYARAERADTSMVQSLAQAIRQWQPARAANRTSERP